jgi:hypothetical protein
MWIDNCGCLPDRTPNSIKNRWNAILKDQHDQGLDVAERATSPPMSDSTRKPNGFHCVDKPKGLPVSCNDFPGLI